MGSLILPLVVCLLAVDHGTGDPINTGSNRALIKLLTVRLEKLEKKVGLIDLLTARLDKLENKVETIYPSDGTSFNGSLKDEGIDKLNFQQSNCSCNGLIDKNGEGECFPFAKGDNWCYVDPNSECNDINLWTKKSGLHHISYQACQDLVIDKEQECPKWRKNIRWMNGRKGFRLDHEPSAEACQQACKTKVDYANDPCIAWTYWGINSSPWGGINEEAQGGRWCSLFSNDSEGFVLGNQTLESTATSSLGAVSGRPTDCDGTSLNGSLKDEGIDRLNIPSSDCSCKRWIDRHGEGECWEGFAWCYVESDSGCNDTKLFTEKSGVKNNYSYQACPHLVIDKELKCPKWRKNIRWMNGRKGFRTLHEPSAEACQQACKTKVDYVNRPCIAWTYKTKRTLCSLFSNDSEGFILGNQTLESTAHSYLGAVSGRPMDCE